jgi:hypothetical protein
MSGGNWEISDKIHRELFEREGGGGLNGAEWGSDRMSANLILLANGTSCHKTGDEDGKAQPPEVLFNNCLGVKASEVTREGRRVYGVEYL